MTNTINVFGWFTIEQIHATLFAGTATLLVGGGIIRGIYNNAKLRRQERGGRQYDNYLDSPTHVSDVGPDGYRTMYIRLLGQPERLENAIRGRKEREWMLEAARHCNWESRRFVKHDDNDKQERILHVVRNRVGGHAPFADGEAARLLGLPTKENDLYYSPTGADTTAKGVRMFRTIIVTKETMQIVRDHPIDKWHFEVDEVTLMEADHNVRVTTIQQMAEAYFNPKHRGCRELDKHWRRVIGWLRPSVRA